jgi:hypothetical protein
MWGIVIFSASSLANCLHSRVSMYLTRPNWTLYEA